MAERLRQEDHLEFKPSLNYTGNPRLQKPMGRTVIQSVDKRWVTGRSAFIREAHCVRHCTGNGCRNPSLWVVGVFSLSREESSAEGSWLRNGVFLLLSTLLSCLPHLLICIWQVFYLSLSVSHPSGCLPLIPLDIKTFFLLPVGSKIECGRSSVCGCEVRQRHRDLAFLLCTVSSCSFQASWLHWAVTFTPKPEPLGGLDQSGYRTSHWYPFSSLDCSSFLSSALITSAFCLPETCWKHFKFSFPGHALAFHASKLSLTKHQDKLNTWTT